MPGLWHLTWSFYRQKTWKVALTFRWAGQKAYVNNGYGHWDHTAWSTSLDTLDTPLLAPYHRRFAYGQSQTSGSCMSFHSYHRRTDDLCAFHSSLKPNHKKFKHSLTFL